MSTSQTGFSSAYAESPSHDAVAPDEGVDRRPPPPPKPRRARLIVSRIDPWSVLKLSLLLSIVMAAVFLIAVYIVWQVLDGMGVFTSIADQVGQITADPNGSGVDVLQYLSLNKVMGTAGVLAVVNVLLMTALATLAAFVYNVSASLVGGLHVTLSESS